MSYQSGNLLVDFEAQLIHILNPQVTLDCQDLINLIRSAEASPEGIQYPSIATASGKESLSDDVSVGLTVNLISPWQIKFWSGNYIAKVFGGNLVGGLSDDPVAYSAGVQVLLIQSAASTVVTTSTGSGLSTEQDTTLTTIHTLLNSIENGMTHPQVMRVLLSAMAGLVSGAEGTEIRFRNNANTKDRIIATVDEHGNRSAVILDVS